MKAWKVQPLDNWWSLVFAESRSKAKQVWLREWKSTTDAEFIELSCTRQPEFDEIFKCEKCIDSNSALPKGIRFWC